MNERSLSVKGLSEQSGIAESTTRRYCTNFKDYLPHETFGRVVKYAPECVEILQRIGALYLRGKTTQEIRAALSDLVKVETVVETAVDDPGTVIALFQAQNKSLDNLTQAIQQLVLQQSEEIARLRAEVDQLQLERAAKKPWWRGGR